VIPGEPTRPRKGLRLWLDATVARAWALGLEAGGAPLSQGGGRGATRLASVEGTDVVLRRVRRGGLLRTLLPDRFLSVARSLREAAALDRLHALGIGPRCLGVEADGRFLVALTVATEHLASARDLRALGALAPAQALMAARVVGETVRRMHDAGVGHPDLNVTNILVAREGGLRAFVVDLDGAILSDGPVPDRERAREILRLCRSLDKWADMSATPAAARAAFLRAALPGERRLGILRRARRAHGRRAALGRRPRTTG
jgi:3-deoxy-D-manno-octulosonic acid kinase